MTGASGVRRNVSGTSIASPEAARQAENLAKSHSKSQFNVQASQDELDKVQRSIQEATAVSVDAKSPEGRVDEFDHVTFWVGNAKHSASFFMSYFGFLPFAFRGLETGSRDLACHVVKLNDTIIQFVSALEPNNEQVGSFLASHGDAVKDVAFRVQNIESLLASALESGAELVAPIEVSSFSPESDKSGLEKCLVKRATIKTFGDVTHTFIERNYDYEHGCFLPGYQEPSLDVSMLFMNTYHGVSVKYFN